VGYESLAQRSRARRGPRLRQGVPPSIPPRWATKVPPWCRGVLRAPGSHGPR